MSSQRQNGTLKKDLRATMKQAVTVASLRDMAPPRIREDAERISPLNMAFSPSPLKIKKSRIKETKEELLKKLADAQKEITALEEACCKTAELEETVIKLREECRTDGECMRMLHQQVEEAEAQVELAERAHEQALMERDRHVAENAELKTQLREITETHAQTEKHKVALLKENEDLKAQIDMLQATVSGEYFKQLVDELSGYNQ